MTRTVSALRSLSYFALFALAALVAAPAEAVRRRAFATSISGTGNLASWPRASGATALDKADAICRARAAAAGLPNATTYRAWLSTAAADAYSHVQGLAGQKSNDCNGSPQPGAGPWFLANGLSNFTGELDELTGPERKIYRPVLVDEFSVLVDPLAARVWTGTAPDGAAATSRCADWSSSANAAFGMMGSAVASASAWTMNSGEACNLAARLLCVEPGASEEVVLGWSPGAMVFVASQTGTGKLSTWPSAGGATGIAAADQVYRTLAAAEHLPAADSFVAWISDSSVAAIDRITVNGPFRRLDGYTVANNRAGLVSSGLFNSIHVDEKGRHATSSGTAWTGTFADGTASTNHCLDWTDDSFGEDGHAGYFSFPRTGRWTNGSDWSCSGTGRRLYCISNVVTLFWDGFESGNAGAWSAAIP